MLKKKIPCFVILFSLIPSCANRAPIPLTDTAVLSGKSFKLEIKKPAILKIYRPNAIIMDGINPNGTFSFSKEKPALWAGWDMMRYVSDPSIFVGTQISNMLKEGYSMRYAEGVDREKKLDADYIVKLHTFHWMLHHNKDKPKYDLEYFMWFRLFDTKSDTLVARVHCLQKMDGIDLEEKKVIRLAFERAAKACVDDIKAKAFGS